MVEVFTRFTLSASTLSPHMKINLLYVRWSRSACENSLMCSVLPKKVFPNLRKPLNLSSVLFHLEEGDTFQLENDVTNCGQTMVFTRHGAFEKKLSCCIVENVGSMFLEFEKNPNSFWSQLYRYCNTNFVDFKGTLQPNMKIQSLYSHSRADEKSGEVL